MPRRDTVVAAIEEIIADAENQFADASDDEATKGCAPGSTMSAAGDLAPARPRPKFDLKTNAVPSASSAANQRVEDAVADDEQAE